MGITLSPCLSNQAIASWAGVQPFLSASVLNWLTSFTFASKFSPENRGNPPRQSPSSDRDSLWLSVPVSNPLPRGAYATRATPSSRQVSTRLTDGLSISSSKGEYSAWSASTWTILQARRSVAALTSDRPMYLIFPCLQCCQIRARSCCAVEVKLTSSSPPSLSWYPQSECLGWRDACSRDQCSLRPGF